MLRLEKFARAPENTALKGPELENLCNDRIKKPAAAGFFISKAKKGVRPPEL